MSFQEKDLGQANPGPVNTVLYPKPANITAVIKLLRICNTSAVQRTFRIFYDRNGVGALTSNAMFYDEKLEANETMDIDGFSPMYTSTGKIWVWASTTDVNFFLEGVELGP